MVMVKQPGHLTSMKKERGAGTSCYNVEGTSQPSNPPTLSVPRIGVLSYLELVLAGLGLRRRVEKVDRENLSGEKKFLLAAWTWMISMGSGLREATATASTR